MQATSLADSSLLSVTERDNQQIDSFVYIYSQEDLATGPVRFKQILNHISQRIQAFSLLRSRVDIPALTLGLPRWKEDERFDIETHVRHIALPKPGDWRQFSIQVARLHSRPLDANLAPWEVYVIEGLDNIEWLPKGSFALVGRIHKALSKNFDKDFAWFLNDDMPLPNCQEHIDNEMNGDKFLSLPGLVKNIVQYRAKLPKHVLSRSNRLLRRKVLPEISFYYKAFLGGIVVPFTRFNSAISSNRVWESCRLPLKPTEEILQLHPAITYREIALTVIAGAMKHYLSNKQELNKSKSLTTLTQVSLPNEGDSIIQEITARIDLSTGTDSPLARLFAITSGVQTEVEKQQQKNQAQWLSPLTLLKRPIGENLPDKWRQALSHPLANTLVGFIETPNKTITLCGAKMINSSVLSAIYDGLGLAHVVTKQDDEMIISVTSCREILPDPTVYNQYLTQAFDELCSSLQES